MHKKTEWQNILIALKVFLMALEEITKTDDWMLIAISTNKQLFFIHLKESLIQFRKDRESF